MATSYNGWPASDDKASIGVVSSDVFPGGAKAGDVTIVLGYVARQLDARVEPCVDGWNWGYTYKANVNNPSQLSCHASGTAIDWNAPDHPNGSSGTFTQAQRGTIYQILDEVQGSVSWLEGYDEMHFEICVTAADLAQVAALLGDAAPPQPEGDWFDMATEDDLRRIVREEIAAVQAVTDDLGGRQHLANTVADTLSAAPKAAQLWQGAEYQHALAIFADRKIPGAADRP
jgi:hypothetical protein